ncbi:MAG: DNA polymerase beta superfamily protein, partial [Janthinobacterium lividum]
EGQRLEEQAGLDLTVFSLRRWVELANTGNPTALVILWVSDASIVASSPAGEELRDGVSRFASVDAVDGLLGYARSQQRVVQRRLRGSRYPVKPAVHALRLASHALELLRSETVTLPVPEPVLGELRAVRCGRWKPAEVLDRYAEYEAQIAAARSRTLLPLMGDREWAVQWARRVSRAG